MLAATALHHNLVLVTRNLKDVAGLPVTVLNPWEAELNPWEAELLER